MRKKSKYHPQNKSLMICKDFIDIWFTERAVSVLGYTFAHSEIWGSHLVSCQQKRSQWACNVIVDSADVNDAATW